MVVIGLLFKEGLTPRVDGQRERIFDHPGGGVAFTVRRAIAHPQRRKPLFLTGWLDPPPGVLLQKSPGPKTADYD